MQSPHILLFMILGEKFLGMRFSFNRLTFPRIISVLNKRFSRFCTQMLNRNGKSNERITRLECFDFSRECKLVVAYIRLVNFAINYPVHWIAYRIALEAASEHRCTRQLCDELSALVRRSWVCLRLCIWFQSPIAVQYCGLQMYYLFIYFSPKHRSEFTTASGYEFSYLFTISLAYICVFSLPSMNLYAWKLHAVLSLSHIKMHNETEFGVGRVTFSITTNSTST